MKNRTIWLAAALIASSVFLTSPAVAGPAEPFTRDANFESVKLSPHGDRLAVTRRVQSRIILTVVQLADMKELGNFGIKDGRDVEDVYWVNNDRLVFGLAYHLGSDEAAYLTRDLFAVNADGSDWRLLIGRPPGDDVVHLTSANAGRNWRIVALPPDDGDSIIVSRYDEDEAPYLVRINAVNGRERRLSQARGRSGAFRADNVGRIRLQTGYEADGTFLVYYRDDDNSDWRDFGRYPVGVNKGGIAVLGFTPDDKALWVLDNRDSSRMGLFRYDPGASKGQLLFRDQTYDVGGILRGRELGSALGAWWEGERTQWWWFDPQAPDAQFYEAVRAAFPDRDVKIQDYDRKRSRVVVLVDGDVDPGTFYVFDLDTKKALARFPKKDWIKSAEMSPMKPFAMKARDGLELHGFLTVPIHGDRKRLVVLPHGGPYDIRDKWDFDPQVQWLAANGYSVLQVNFRGSGGYGGALTVKGYGQWGDGMIDDIADATRWAIAQGVADAQHVCIMGTSYGGYAALESVERTPDLYRCAIGISGVYDMDSLRRETDFSFFSPGMKNWEAKVGTDPVMLARISPAQHADAIKVPVLLIHGGEDKRAPKTQFYAMKDALTAANHAPETLFKDGEGHGFTNAKNREEEDERIVKFLDANIGM